MRATIRDPEEEVVPQFEVTHFISLENEQWYHAHAHKQLIKGKSLDTNISNYSRVEKCFARLGRESILNLPKNIYPNLVREFYAKMVDKKGHSGALLDTSQRYPDLSFKK